MSDLQRTEEWYKDRLGKFTGSRFVDVLARSKRDGSKLKAWHDVIDEVVAERITEFSEGGIDSYSMRWGREIEGLALSNYELENDCQVTQVGFIQHPRYEFVGASPDGLVGEDGGLEIKCPKDSKIHIRRLEEGMDEDEFMPQVQGCLWVTGRQWWDWMSYDPRIKIPELRIYKKRCYRDEAYIANLEAAVMEAEARVQEIIEKLKIKAA